MVEQWLDSTGRVIREGYGQTETVRRSLLHESLVNSNFSMRPKHTISNEKSNIYWESHPYGERTLLPHSTLCRKISEAP